MDNLVSPKAFFFDLFGTLLVFPAFDAAHVSWISALHELVGKPNRLSLEQIEAMATTLLTTRCTRDAAAGLTTYETKIRKALEKLGVTLGAERLHQVADGSLETWQQGVRVADDALDVLRHLKRAAKIVLITNFDHSPHVRQVLDRSGLGALLDDVIISDEVGYDKPQPEIFRLALQRNALSGSEVVHVGDGMRDDVQGALAAGIRPILIDRDVKSHADYGKPEAPLSADYRTVHSLSELLAPAGRHNVMGPRGGPIRLDVPAS